jgi:hypothetical protein
MRPLPCDEELPPPQYYHRSVSQSTTSTSHEKESARNNIPTAILSLVKPHKILSISSDFLGFGAEEMMGRSLNLLHGPNTDAKALTGAIKNAGLLSSTKISTTLYSRDGSELCINASCVPYFDEGGALAGCKLQLLPEENDYCLDEAGTERLRSAAHRKRTCYRSKYNFTTGLTIQCSMLHLAKARSSQQGAADNGAQHP